MDANADVQLHLPSFADSHTKYKFWLKAFTWKNEGERSSPPFQVTTDVRRPDAPFITNLTCKDDSSLFVEWDVPPGRNAGRRKAYVGPFPKQTAPDAGVHFYFVSYHSRVQRGEYQTVTLDRKSAAFSARRVRTWLLKREKAFKIQPSMKRSKSASCCAAS